MQSRIGIMKEINYMRDKVRGGIYDIQKDQKSKAREILEKIRIVACSTYEK